MQELLEVCLFGDGEKILSRFFTEDLEQAEHYLKKIFIERRDGCYCAWASRRDPMLFMSYYFVDGELIKLPDAVVLSRQEAQRLKKRGV
jgi:hypothetical protein